MRQVVDVVVMHAAISQASLPLAGVVGLCLTILTTPVVCAHRTQ